MANYKVIDADQLDSDLTSVADSIRTKGGTTAALAFPEGFKTAIAAIEIGGGGGGAIVPVSPKAVNFRDYDGTVLYSYTAEEAVALTELPPLPTQPGLVCQEWNWSLSGMQTYVSEYGRCEVGATYITDDGKTRIYVTLPEGHISPMLGVCPNGTVTVDWGDGSTPDTLTGTSTSSVQWTPPHEYEKPGDYVIALTVDGSMGFYGTNYDDRGSAIFSYSPDQNVRNWAYRNYVNRIEIGNGIMQIDRNSFYRCAALQNVTIPKGVNSIGNSAFNYCAALQNVTIPKGVNSASNSYASNCTYLRSVSISEDLKTACVNFAYNLCSDLLSVTIPKGTTSIGTNAFNNCHALSSVTIPSSVASINSQAFASCYGVVAYDFTSHTAVPTLANTNVFTGIASDCVIKVPAALADEWKAATNWSTYASYIVGV